MTQSLFSQATDLTGKVVVITGAAGGIGRAMAEAFSQSGATLALTDRTDGHVELARQLGAQHRAWTFDATDASAIENFAKEARAHFGRIDVLVNNAGIGLLAPAELLSIADWDLTIAVNLRAPYLFARACAPAMLDGGWGRVITISSQAAIIGIDEHVAYSASKAGLLGMTNCLALEWGPRGVTANCISPTVVETELAKVGWSGEKGEKARAEIPTRRFAQPSEIALAAVFLAGDASAMINGANLVIDGGFTIR